MLINEYRVYPQLKGVNGWGIDSYNFQYSGKLAATTEQTVTVPAATAVGPLTTKHVYGAIISCTTPVWYALNQTAAIPVGATFAATTSRLLPAGETCIQCNSGDVLHFISELTNNSIGVTIKPVQG